MKIVLTSRRPALLAASDNAVDLLVRIEELARTSSDPMPAAGARAIELHARPLIDAAVLMLGDRARLADGWQLPDLADGKTWAMLRILLPAHAIPSAGGSALDVVEVGIVSRDRNGQRGDHASAILTLRAVDAAVFASTVESAEVRERMAMLAAARAHEPMPLEAGFEGATTEAALHALAARMSAAHPWLADMIADMQTRSGHHDAQDGRSQDRDDGDVPPRQDKG